MGMNIQKSAGVKADTFILKRNNMDRRIRMDVAMLIILAICTRLVAGIMNMEKMDAYTGSGEGFCKAVSESHGVDMVKDCFELETQKVCSACPYTVFRLTRRAQSAVPWSRLFHRAFTAAMRTP